MLISFILLIISLAFYLFVYGKVGERTILLLKLLTSSFFVLVGIMAYIETNNVNSTFAFTMILGLIMGFIGDTVLGLINIYPKKKMPLFLIGISIFLGGHICYLISFARYATYPWYLYISISSILVLITIIILKLSKVELGKTEIIDYVYMGLCGTVLTICIFNCIAYTDNFLNWILVTFAMINFIFSDFILCFLYFKKMDKNIRYKWKIINIITYYVAQAMLACSIAFFI